MGKIFFCAASPLLVAISSFASEVSSTQFGPLHTYAQSPFITNGLAPQLRSGFSMPNHAVELNASLALASIWANNSVYELDYYQNQLHLNGKWQINEAWQWEIGYRINHAGNNSLDSLTIAFHDWFSIDQNGRDEVDNDRYIISAPSYGIDEKDFHGDIISQGIYSYLQYQLYQHDNHGLSIGLSLYYSDLGSGFFAHSDWEQALQLNYGFLTGNHAIDVTLSQTFRDVPTNFDQMPYVDNNWFVGGSYRYQWYQNHFLVMQLGVYEGISEADDEFANVSTDVTLGYRFEMEQSALEFSVIENMINADNSTDIAFTFAYRYRYGGSN
ncbi:hypothetical protein BIY21_14565 [Vibrio ponticus]|uniref:DUF3187 family protein n=1 Tax=Vibrio ponticus TaxID=265668 RepID=A0ABX3FD37_9VIBR|nr:DUF3187 family protein [Vibrio ponticus]OLQ89868.1 hypothetical protein BIY21_14565 [Vibrio ponticus]